MKTFNLAQFAERSALIDGATGRTLSYEDLDILTEKVSKNFGQQKTLSFLFISSKIESVIAYLSLINSHHAVAIFDEKLHPDLKTHLISQYQPHYILESAHEGQEPTLLLPDEYFEVPLIPLPSMQFWHHRTPEKSPTLHPDLKLLMSTSGTTGSPKLIRLSQKNLTSNAEAICSFLNLDFNERPIALLPLHYSYGLSVLHSHLIAGATIVLTSSSIIQDEFWQILNRFSCTSLSGVPYTFQLLDRIGLENIDCPSLRTLTQAGGKLSSSMVAKFHGIMKKRNGSFFSMYGQTEATARIAYLPPAYLPEKAGAIGIAIPGGMLQLFNKEEEILDSDTEGELVYSGPNVMLGLANCLEDLALGDQLKGVLRTGDLGVCDSDGIYFITGRLKRISKVYGLRVNLDEIEQACGTFGSVAATSDDNTIRLYYETEPGLDIEPCIASLSETFRLAPATFECVAIPHFPLTSTDKIDYTKLS